jgi:hypothetical protein
VPLVKFTSFLVEKTYVPVTVDVAGEKIALLPDPGLAVTEPVPAAAESAGVSVAGDRMLAAQLPEGDEYLSVSLIDLAWARSGDKGDTANIGVIARRKEFVDVLREQLTPDRVALYFSHLVRGTVRRYELPGIDAFNFTLDEALDGGGMASMRIDPLAKGMAQMLLDVSIAIPAAYAGYIESMSDKKTFKPGDHVTWNSSQGSISGTVEKKLTSPRSIKGHEVKASAEHPEYLVKSDKTGAEAAHKPDALH